MLPKKLREAGAFTAVLQRFHASVAAKAQY